MKKMALREMTEVVAGKTKYCPNCFKSYKTKFTWNLHWLTTFQSACKNYAKTHPW